MIGRLCLTLAAAALGLFLAITPGAAQSPPADKVEVMDELVISATRTERLRSLVPVSVTVITREEIAASPERNLDEILRQQIGVDLSRRTGIAIGIPGRLDLRGVPGPNRTLVLVDGFPLNGSGTGFVNLQQIPLEAIERVEIIRGPYSCLYGANALGGVINIITRRGQGRPEVGVQAGVGNQSWHQTALQASGGGPRGNFFAYGDRRRTDNYWFSDFELKESFNRATGQSTLEEIPSFNRSYEDWRYIGTYSVGFSPTTWGTLHTRFYKNFTGLGRTENLTPNRDEQTRGEVYFGGLTLASAPHENLSLLVRGYARQSTDQLWSETSFLETIFIPLPRPGRFVTIPRFGPGYFRAVSRDFYVEGQSTLHLGEYHTLTAGFDVLRVQAQFDPVIHADTKALFPGSAAADEGITTFGFYLQDEFRWGRLSVIPGLRVDKHSLFSAVLSPKLGVTYRLFDHTTLRASAGRAYRAPSVTELFRPEWNLNPFIRLRPNPNLKPEYIWSVDGGIEHYLTPTLRLTLDGFYNDMKDFIVTPAVPGERGIIQYQNLSSSWSAGMEAAAEWRVYPWLTLFGNYTFLQSHDKENDTRIQNLPDHKFNLGLRVNYRWRDWRFSGTVVETFVGERNVQPLGTTTFVSNPSFALTDLALYARYKELATVGITVQNLFDRKYQETRGYLGPGRLATGYAGLRWQF
jgi:outer membrane cobalamin receptor